MCRLRVMLSLLGLVALLVVPSAAGVPDSTPPVITLAIIGTSGSNGWYTSNVTVDWSRSDPESGIQSSSGCDTTTLTTDTPGVVLTCSATNNADVPLTSSISVTVKIDKTAPQTAAASPDRAPDGGGWYNHPVAVAFSGTDALSGIDSCVSMTYGGPDSAGTTLTGSCRDKAGNTSSALAFSLEYDATAPETTAAAPDRQPDANGWYNHPVAFAFQGSDAGSGIESCTAVTYEGPDAEGASITGACRDKAGNSSAPRSFSLKYDATAPGLAGATVEAGDRTATLRWQASADTELVEILRSRGLEGGKTRIYRGKARSFKDRALRNGLKYRYTITGYDQAGNSVGLTVVATPRPPLVAPRRGARLSLPPLLAWTPVEKAPFYNVQLYRGTEKILTIWPLRPRFRLRRTWVYGGVRYELTPGRYRWYVWPGRKSPFGRRYGKLLGQSHFVVE